MFPENSLYFVADSEYCRHRDVCEVAAQALDGGVDIVQMRQKNIFGDDLAVLGKKLQSVCASRRGIFIVNDDPFLAKAISADGVHMGQSDIAGYGLARVREIVGKGKIIGISTHSREQFIHANAQEYDYIAFGPIFPTQTKDYCIGTQDVEKVLTLARKPVVFIGGIDSSTAAILLEKGVTNIAVIRAIAQADNVREAAAALKHMMRTQGKK